MAIRCCAIAKSGLDRGDVFVTSKLANDSHRPDTPDRIEENIGIFDFELSGQDVEAIRSLNRDQRTGPDPDKFDVV
jgi:diketogulonate reductase-like aldo/keto reductase